MQKHLHINTNSTDVVSVVHNPDLPTFLLIRDSIWTIVMTKRTWGQRANSEKLPDTRMCARVSVCCPISLSVMKSFLLTLHHSICHSPRDFLWLTRESTDFGVMCWFRLDLAVFYLCDSGHVIPPLWASYPKCAPPWLQRRLSEVQSTNMSSMPLDTWRFYSLCFIHTLSIFSLTWSLESILFTCPLSPVHGKHVEGETRCRNPFQRSA